MQITKRDMLAAAGAVTAMTFTGTAFGRWEPSERYPDPAVQVLDPSFNKYRLALAGVERLAGGMRWCEGPVYFGDARYLLWSDIPNNRIMRWDEETGRSRASFASRPTMPTATPATARAGWSPASTTAAASPAPSMTAPITVLIDKFDGKPLNSPNDVVVKSDDSIWFTDPPFGILGNYEGHVATPELPTNVYRVDQDRTRDGGDGRRQSAERACVLARRDEALHRRGRRDAARDPRLRRGRRRHQARQPAPVHHRRAGRHARRLPRATSTAISGAAGAWGTRSRTGSRSSIPTGKPIGFIALPERCANVCFGGPKRNRLFMAASHSVYSLYVNTQGAPGG